MSERPPRDPLTLAFLLLAIVLAVAFTAVVVALLVSTGFGRG